MEQTPVFEGGPIITGKPVDRKKGLLDHGYVRLVDSMGSDLSVVRAARVSYDAAWRAGQDQGSDFKLINYLWNHNHSTPFEAVTFTFEVMAPIFVFRQWHRHRTQTYNELSARYKELPEVYYKPSLEDIGVQSKDNKQMRTDWVPDESDPLYHQRLAELEEYDSHCMAAFELYRKLLASGWPRELARGVLPMCTYSHMFCTMNLLNLLKFLTLRCDPHAQKEIRVYADAMRDLAREIVPVCIDAWEKKNGRNRV